MDKHKDRRIRKLKNWLTNAGIFLVITIVMSTIFIGGKRLMYGFWVWEGIKTPVVVVDNYFDTIDEPPEEETFKMTVRYRDLVYTFVGRIGELEQQKCKMVKEIVRDYTLNEILKAEHRTNKDRAKALENSDCK